MRMFNMDKCYYNGNMISASEFARFFETETELRKNSSLLVCCDPECHNELIFKNGPIRVAHFAHKKVNVQCCYNEYSSKMEGVMKEIRDAVYTRLKEIEIKTGYVPDYDVRISRDYRHITPVTLSGNHQFAVDIMRSNKTANKLEIMNSTYKNMGFIPLPIIIEDISNHFNDMRDAHYTLRYWLHKSNTHTALVFNQGLNRYYMCKMDDEEYIFEGNNIERIGFINVFVKNVELSKLEVSDNGFDVPGFNSDFLKWKDKKRQELDEYIAKIKKQRVVNFERKTKAEKQVHLKSIKEVRNAESLIDRRKRERNNYDKRIFPLLQELANELDFEVSEEELKSYYEFEKDKKTLYKMYPDRNRIKNRLRSQLLIRREK